MSSKRLHYSDEKWLDLISECRSSGLSDKDWCMEHQIGISTFYYHVKRLRNKACSIPPAAVGAVIPCQKQEVVELNFNPVFKTRVKRKMKNTIKAMLRVIGGGV